MGSISGPHPAALPVSSEPGRKREISAQAVAEAASRLNDRQVAGENREITFSVDQATRRPIVRVVDTQTKEVVNQWPAEYVLRLDATGVRDSG